MVFQLLQLRRDGVAGARSLDPGLQDPVDVDWRSHAVLVRLLLLLLYYLMAGLHLEFLEPLAVIIDVSRLLQPALILEAVRQLVQWLLAHFLRFKIILFNYLYHGFVVHFDGAVVGVSHCLGQVRLADVVLLRVHHDLHRAVQDLLATRREVVEAHIIVVALQLRVIHVVRLCGSG